MGDIVFSPDSVGEFFIDITSPFVLLKTPGVMFIYHSEEVAQRWLHRVVKIATLSADALPDMLQLPGTQQCLIDDIR